MTRLPKHGDVFFALQFDPNGRNPKFRRSVVLTATHEIALDGEIVVAAITGVFNPDSLEDTEVPISWAAGGHPKTSLDKPSVAKCDWQTTVLVSEVEYAGYLSGKELFAVMKVIANLNAEEQSQ